MHYTNRCLKPWEHVPSTLMPQDVRLMNLAFTLANRATAADIETNAVPTRTAGDDYVWYDVRPMTDPHEHCGVAVDMAAEALAYADQSGLITRHPQHPYLVRINRAELQPARKAGAA